MKFTPVPAPNSTLETMPPDVSSHIALDTVSLTSGIPTPRELGTLNSLMLTSRIFYRTLSMRNNPDLYAKIFRLSFDVDAVQRRMGTNAVLSSALASELKRRVEALKRLNAGLDGPVNEEGGWDEISQDLTRMWLMMTENDGKNRHQLVYFVDTSRLLDIFCAYVSRIRFPGELTRSTSVPLIAALMWMSSTGEYSGCLADEHPDRRTKILDLLQPFVLGYNSWPGTSVFVPGALPDCASVTSIEYFGLRCTLKLPSSRPFARLCTAGLYGADKQTQGIGSGRTCTPAVSKSSAEFDDDWLRHICVDLSPSGSDKLGSLTNQVYTLGTFEGLWDGAWFTPCSIGPVPEIITYAQPMQYYLREYVSLHADDSVSFVNQEGGNDGNALARAWFPKGIKFNETTTSLKIYDPTKEQWLCYKPCSEVLTLSNENSVMVDTILVGNTEATYGARYGEYMFHGRVHHKDGSVALVRRPADPIMDGLGTWVFNGQIHGHRDFVGDWRVTSTVMYTAAGQGWFQFSKVGLESGVD